MSQVVRADAITRLSFPCLPFSPSPFTPPIMATFTKEDELAIATIRTLAVDTVSKANSGHPGASSSHTHVSPGFSFVQSRTSPFLRRRRQRRSSSAIDWRSLSECGPSNRAGMRYRATVHQRTRSLNLVAGRRREGGGRWVIGRAGGVAPPQRFDGGEASAKADAVLGASVPHPHISVHTNSSVHFCPSVVRTRAHSARSRASRENRAGRAGGACSLPTRPFWASSASTSALPPVRSSRSSARAGS